jgi:Secretion system C-terminal sorting domain
MKKGSLLSFLLLFVIVSRAQTLINQQYASSVISFSSQNNTTNYSANQILGAPDYYPGCGGDKAWTPATEDGGPEFIEVAYATPQPVNTIRIYQTNGAGSVTSVLLREAGTSNWNTVYTATAAANGCAKILEIVIPTTAYNVDGLRINIDNNVPNSQYFDAVSIANFSLMPYSWNQYVGSVIAFSTQYSSSSWSADQTKGAPNAYPACNDNSNAWAPSSQDGTSEYLVLGFSYPAKTNRIRIFETYNPGFIEAVYLRDASNGTWHQIYSTTAAATGVCPYILELDFTTTTYDVDAIRIEMTTTVPGWNEIDAVEMQSSLPANAKFTVQSGNWSNTATWAGGTVPGPTDTVVLGNGHTVTMDVNASIKSAFLGNGSNLVIPSGTSLTLGPSGGGREYLLAQGALTINNGQLTVNGNVQFFAGSTFTMSSGNFTVDGNDGTTLGSVADGVPLVKFDPGMAAVNFSGGTLLIVDPQYNATGQSIAGNYTLGTASTVRFGNGVSTTASNNLLGFGGGDVFPIFGNMMLDAASTTSNRLLRNTSAIQVKSNLDISSGLLNPAYPFEVTGNTGNNGTITSNYSFKTGSLVNNGTINGNGTVSVVGDFTNTGVGVYNLNAYSSVGGNLANAGSFTATWLYFANDFSTNVTTQSISGGGTYNIYGLEFLNTSSGGVNLQTPLEVQQVYWGLGILNLGNNNLTIDAFSYGGPGAGNYIVINGTGKLINKNISTSPVLLPIGTATDYTPVTIANGSGHTFSASVRQSFSGTTPSAPVLREWNVTDETGGAVSANITLQWNAADEDAAFTRNNCYIGHWNGASWDAISSGNPATGTNPYQKTANNVTSFSPFGVFSGGAILPVHLITFEARKQGNGVGLSWKVDNETNMSRYEIEHSNNARNFLKILSVAAVNQSSVHTYDVSDALPLSGSNFYRLKQLNTDGSYDYSPIVKIDFVNKYSVFIYPNPAKNSITVQGMENFKTIELLDAQGKLVKQWKVIRNEPLNISDIHSGIYLIRLITDDETQLQKLIISR